jgi:hypothetical protein
MTKPDMTRDEMVCEVLGHEWDWENPVIDDELDDKALVCSRCLTVLKYEAADEIREEYENT